MYDFIVNCGRKLQPKVERNQIVWNNIHLCPTIVKLSQNPHLFHHLQHEKHASSRIRSSPLIIGEEDKTLYGYSEAALLLTLEIRFLRAGHHFFSCFCKNCIVLAFFTNRIFGLFDKQDFLPVLPAGFLAYQPGRFFQLFDRQDFSAYLTGRIFCLFDGQDCSAI